MRLTKLELHGFKSFADGTHLVFEPGVTAIVIDECHRTTTGCPGTTPG